MPSGSQVVAGVRRPVGFDFRPSTGRYALRLAPAPDMGFLYDPWRITVGADAGSVAPVWRTVGRRTITP